MIDFWKWAAKVRFLFVIGGCLMGKAEKAQGTGGAAAAVERLVRPTVEGMGLQLWDVRFEKEGPDWFLRVLIDRDTPLDTDTCEAVSRAIDPILDEADLIQQSYYLEVGSPGLGRRLTRPEHYQALKGQKCLAHLYDNSRNTAAAAALADGPSALRNHQEKPELYFGRKP